MPVDKGDYPLSTNAMYIDCGQRKKLRKFSGLGRMFPCVLAIPSVYKGGCYLVHTDERLSVRGDNESRDSVIRKQRR